jgi:hypothetical protein
MRKDVPDCAFHLKTIEALRADGAEIFETDDTWFAEVRSTLKALRLRRTATVKRRLAELECHVLVKLPGGRMVFVPQPSVDAVVEAYDGDVQIMQSRRSTRPLVFLPWYGIGAMLFSISHHPAAIAWTQWFIGEFLPAIQLHGWYDPATHHDPPPSQLLDAIERKERQRDLLNGFIPGLGDLLHGTQAGV